jgi:hypothetical protein
MKDNSWKMNSAILETTIFNIQEETTFLLGMLLQFV